MSSKSHAKIREGRGHVFQKLLGTDTVWDGSLLWIVGDPSLSIDS
ncbi:MAG: hypothetical protein ACPGLY_24740 [Rubripirellula sp.]